MNTSKHTNEMPDDTLLALGFIQKPSPYGGGDYWTHQMSTGKFYYHILTPEAVRDALIEIGKEEFRRKAIAALGCLTIGEGESL